MGNKRGSGFFTVDRWIWGRLCDSCSINEAAAYLVLAQGTGADNRSTSWSATSLKKYAAISWERATSAIDGLDAKGYIKAADTSTPSRPRYQIPSAADLTQAAFAAKLAALTEDERQVLNHIREGHNRRRHDYHTLRKLRELGLIRDDITGKPVAVDPPSSREADPIWLPNTLVTGSGSGEEAPVKRLRSAGDLWTLRLLIELYHAHNLRDDGGISPTVIRREFSRMLAGEHGIFTVWAFKPGSCTLWWKGCLEAHRNRQEDAAGNHPIWDCLRRLEREGLVTFVPHLWENGSDNAEVIHAYGVDGAGEPLEWEIGRAAHQAALAMIPEFKAETAMKEGFCHFAPVKRTLPDVQMIGVARLRYRPHTSRTREWYTYLAKNGPVLAAGYREDAETAQRKTA